MNVNGWCSIATCFFPENITEGCKSAQKITPNRNTQQFWIYSMGLMLLEVYTAWWLTYPSEKYDFVSWDDDYSQYMEKKMFQTTNQIWIVKRIITATEISLTISHSISGYTSQKKKSASAMVTWMCILLSKWGEKPPVRWTWNIPYFRWDEILVRLMDCIHHRSDSWGPHIPSNVWC